MTSYAEDIVEKGAPVRFIFVCNEEPCTWILRNVEFYQSLRDPSPYAGASGYKRIFTYVFENRFEMLRRLCSKNKREFVRNLATYGINMSNRTPKEQQDFKCMCEGVFGVNFERQVQELNLAEVREVEVAEETVTLIEPLIAPSAIAVEDRSVELPVVKVEAEQGAVPVPIQDGKHPIAPFNRASGKQSTLRSERLIHCMDRQYIDMQCLINSRVKPFSEMTPDEVKCRKKLRDLLTNAPGRLDSEWKPGTAREKAKVFRMYFTVPAGECLERMWDVVNDGGMGELSGSFLRFLLLCLGYGYNGYGERADGNFYPEVGWPNFPVTDCKIFLRQAFKWPDWLLNNKRERLYLQCIHCDENPFAFFIRIQTEAALCGGRSGYDGQYGFYVEGVKRQPWYTIDDFQEWESGVQLL